MGHDLIRHLWEIQHHFLNIGCIAYFYTGMNIGVHLDRIFPFDNLIEAIYNLTVQAYEIDGAIDCPTER